MKLVFLDVDGVLNSEQYVHEIGNEWDDNQIDPKAVARLNRLTDETDALIVVSSSWRLGVTIQHLRNTLAFHGVKGYVLGATKYLGSDRANEIWDWIDSAKKKSYIDSFVILDDDRLELRRDQSDPVLDLHFVRTSWLDGLQDHHIEKAIKILDEVKFNLNVVKRGAL